MRKLLNVALVGILAFGLLGCPQRTERTDGGGVLITFGQIDWPVVYSMAVAASAGAAAIETVTLMSVAKDPNGTTSAPREPSPVAVMAAFPVAGSAIDRREAGISTRQTEATLPGRV